MRHREPAICLRTSDYSETSQVVRFFTRGCGVVRLIAKGTKRPRSKSGGAIDLLAEGDLVFTLSRSGGLGTLIEFTETFSRSGLRKDAVGLNAALYVIELVDEMLAECDPLPEAFDLLRNTLARLGETGAPTAAVLAYFQWRLLRHVGLLGELKACASCQTPVRDQRDTYFSSSAGGFLCDGCEGAASEKLRLDRPTLAGLVAMEAAEAGKKVLLPENQARGVNRMLAYHVTYQLGKRLKMTRYAISPAEPKKSDRPRKC